jgi:pilus assembly protein CpaF
VNAIAVVEDEVRELVRRRGLDPAEQPAAVRRLVDEVIADYDERSISGALPPLPDTRSAARAVFDAVAGFGPLQPYLDDPLVEEIWIDSRAWVQEHVAARSDRGRLAPVREARSCDGILRQ